MNRCIPSALVLILSLIHAVSAVAQVQPERESLPNLDRRIARAVDAAAKAPDPVTALRNELPSVRVDFDELVGSPKMISVPDGFLTGPAIKGRAMSSAAAADPDQTTKSFIEAHRDLFAHGSDALDRARKTREVIGANNGMRSVVWQQQVNGIPVFDAVFVSHTTKAGELVNISSGFVPSPDLAAQKGVSDFLNASANPPISAQTAVKAAAENLGETLNEEDVAIASEPGADAEQRQSFRAPGLAGESSASLTLLPMNRDAMRLCWDVVLTSQSRGEMYRVLVDAESGDILLRRCLTAYLSAASYRVFTSDSPSPFSPGNSSPVSIQPLVVSRTLVAVDALNTNASPNGWINDGGNETLGNNVDAHTDKNADNIADLPRPQGSPSRVFDFAMDLTQSPSVYSEGSVVQLFYLCNWMHDRLYELGFNEAAGNFQSNNFGKGGYGNDAVQADAQDGSGYNNANFSTPPDGSAGRMQMYLFNGPSPYRDGDLDAEIVLHEYTHGLSNRRVGGGIGISALQSGGMGEGWSDFYGLALLSEPGDDVNGVYAAGAYATYQMSGLTQNYYFGIRRYPYCTDMLKNPLTFKDIDSAQASAHTGIPRSSIIGTTANEVHNMGEVWCVTLWEARANLINKYGWAAGNQLILQLVSDGMNLSPANPNFLQARDAILQADLVDNGGANRNALWAAFAKRGMGASAISPASSTTTGLVEAYDLPDTMSVNPGTGLNSSGQIGGPFTPGDQTYTLMNNGSNALTWVAWTSQPWLAVNSSGGNLAIGASTNVSVSINSAANVLSAGTYSGNIVFSNAVTGVAQTRAVSLYVSPPRVYYFSFDTDPGWSRQGEWAFGKPQGLGGGAFGLPDPTSGATGVNVFGINLMGNYSTTIGGPYYLTAGPLDFSGYTGVKLQFQRRLNSDYPSYVSATIQISTNGGASWFTIWSNSVGVFIYDSAWTRYTYDISAYADNRSSVYVRWGHQVGSSGAFTMSGWNIDDVEFLGNSLQNIKVAVPSIAKEGDTALTGTVTVTPAPSSDLAVTLISSDTTEVSVPAVVVVPAGQSNAVFNLTVVDDSELDGTQMATITASASGYQPSNANISIQDNDSATLSVELPPSVTEGQGIVQGKVSVDKVPLTNFTVDLSSSDDTEIQVPFAVILPAGQTSVVFNATVVNDGLIDGTQPAVVTAHVANWLDGAASVSVLDDENLNLTVNLPPNIWENAGVVSGGGSVSISGTLPTNLVVSLYSGNLSKITVPASAVIPAGFKSAAFDLTLIDNSLTDGHQKVAVSATASGFAGNASSMIVLDDESPLPPFNPVPADFATRVVQTTAISWQNGAFPGKIVTNHVYFGTSPIFSPENLLGVTTNSNWTLPALAPLTTYYWQIVAKSDGEAPGPIWQFTTRGVDHFDWSSIPSPQIVGTPFNAGLVAKDVFNNVVSNFNGSAQLSGSTTNQNSSKKSILVIETGSSISGSVNLALTNMGRSFDFIHTTSFSGSLLSLYDTVIVGMNGGTMTYEDMSVLGSAANAGTKLILIGGSSLQPFANGLNDFLLRTDTDNYNWDIVSGTPSMTVIAPDHPLAAGLPKTCNFADPGATYYMARITDPDATIVATNGDGFATLVTKPVGLGRVVMFVNIADDAFWTFPADFAVFSTVISNSLALVEGGQSISIPVAPAATGAFTNGVWSGDVTVLAPSTNMVLHASNGNGQTNSSNPFEVLLQNDVGITIEDSPDPASIGANLTYTLTVNNVGPQTAAGVVVTNLLPPEVTFVSATASQGSCVHSNGIVACDLGSISEGADVLVTIVVVPNTAGTVITNTATVSRQGVDPYVLNNIAVATTTVIPPTISIANASMPEGNVGISNMTFMVSLAAAAGQPVTVSYSTANGSAVSGSDYVYTSGNLLFNPGVTNMTIDVPIIGDVAIEAGETFAVNLSSPVNAVLGQGSAVGTILNDDGLPGQVYTLQWNTVLSPKYQNQSFVTALTARDASGFVVSNFNGVVALGGRIGVTPVPVSPAVSGNFTNGIWSGSVTVPVIATNLTLRADDLDGHIGLSNPFHVVATNQPPIAVVQPTNTTVFLGGNTSLQIGVFGAEPLDYQWRLNGVDIPGATNSVLQLKHVLFDRAGSYSAVIRNPYGTNSSGKALLTIQQTAAWGAGTNVSSLYFNYGQSIVPVNATNVAGIAGGLYHTVALLSSGKVIAWGSGTNYGGQVPGYGQSIVPAGLANVVAVAAGGYHSLALRADGTVAAWGAGTNYTGSYQNFGQCLVPAAATNIVAIAAGDLHSVALRADGRVFVWGYNSYMQTNVPVAATTNVVAIASRGNHVLALKSDSTLVHWGYWTTQPSSSSNLVAIAVGVNHCLGLRFDGTVISWGTQTIVPAGLSNVVDIAAGFDHSVALRSDGRVVTWGVTNTYGRGAIPLGLTNAIGIGCGTYHSLAYLSDGAPRIRFQPVSRSVSIGSSATLNVLAVGAPLSYQWQIGGVKIPGATNATLAIKSVQALDAGNYQVTITNVYGSVTSSVATLTILVPIGLAVDAPNLTWSTSGNAAWFGQNTTTHDGVDAAQSGTILDGQQTSVQTTVAGPGTINFWWKVSSEEYFDTVNFYVDGVLQNGISGETDWQLQNVPVGSGTHLLKWTYAKDSSVSVGKDAAWLDQVEMVTNAPTITLQPSSQTNAFGSTVLLTVVAAGAPPLSYQWQKAGTNLPGAVSSALVLPNVARCDASVYAVLVSNPGGSSRSSNAVVRVSVPQVLTTAGISGNGGFALRAGDVGGGLLSPDDLSNFEAQASTNLTDWVSLPNALSISNGTLWLSDDDSTNLPMRFYRVIEH